jgi:hypothetical protein
MQTQPAHWAVHAVHIDDHEICVGFGLQYPESEPFIGIRKRQFQRRFSGLIHAGQA